MTSDDLRAWQKAMGYTQAEAAIELGISLATYKRYLTGEVPRAIWLATLALGAKLDKKPLPRTDQPPPTSTSRAPGSIEVLSL